jgi:chromosome segregation ATPase
VFYNSRQEVEAANEEHNRGASRPLEAVMELESLIHRVEARLVEVGQRVLNLDFAAESRDEIEEIRREQTHWRDELQRVQAARSELATSISEHETAVALLPSQIESSFRRQKASQALRQALELDRIRQTLAAEKANLARLDQVVWSIGFHLRHLQKRLELLRQPAARRS